MATSINRRVPSRVFRRRRLSKGVLGATTLPRASQNGLLFCRYKNALIIRPICVLKETVTKFHSTVSAPIETQSGRITKIFVATEKKAVFCYAQQLGGYKKPL